MHRNTDTRHVETINCDLCSPVQHFITDSDAHHDVLVPSQSDWCFQSPSHYIQFPCLLYFPIIFFSKSNSLQFLQFFSSLSHTLSHFGACCLTFMRRYLLDQYFRFYFVGGTTPFAAHPVNRWFLLHIHRLQWNVHNIFGRFIDRTRWKVAVYHSAPRQIDYCTWNGTSGCRFYHHMRKPLVKWWVLFTLLYSVVLSCSARICGFCFHKHRQTADNFALQISKFTYSFCI